MIAASKHGGLFHEWDTVHTDNDMSSVDDPAELKPIVAAAIEAADCLTQVLAETTSDEAQETYETNEVGAEDDAPRPLPLVVLRPYC